MGTAHLVGIEGTFELGDVLTWGAGAVRRNDMLYNSISGLSTPSSRLQELASYGALTIFHKPIPLSSDFTGWVLLMESSAPSIFDAQHQDGVCQSDTQEGLKILLFPKEAFEAYRDRVASEVSQTFMGGSRDKELAELAMVLCPSHPAILAIYSALHYAKDRQHLLRARCKTPEQQEIFDLALQRIANDPRD